jgi:polyphosphate kinase
MNEQSSAIPEALEKASTAFPQALEKADLANLHTSVDRFVNREFSWLQFNRRVLEEAENKHQPLLERLRFLSISAANLDEFFMVRIAGLAGQVRAGVSGRSDDGRTPQEQLEFVLDEVVKLQIAQQHRLDDLRAEMLKENIEIVRPDRLTASEQSWLEDHFLETIYPVLTPLAIDPAHPFPFIPNLGFSIAMLLNRSTDNRPMTALLRLPQALKRFIQIPDDKGRFRFLTLEDAISLFTGRLFPGYEVKGAGTFRIIRDSDIEVE